MDNKKIDAEIKRLQYLRTQQKYEEAKLKFPQFAEQIFKYGVFNMKDATYQISRRGGLNSLKFSVYFRESPILRDCLGDHFCHNSLMFEQVGEDDGRTIIWAVKKNNDSNFTFEHVKNIIKVAEYDFEDDFDKEIIRISESLEELKDFRNDYEK